MTLVQGTLRGFDSGTWTADVQLDGDFGRVLAGVAVLSTVPSAHLVASARVLVAVTDSGILAGYVVVGVISAGATPAAWVTDDEIVDGSVGDDDVGGGIAASKVLAGAFAGAALAGFPAGVRPGPTAAGAMYHWVQQSPGTGEHNTGIAGRGLAVVFARSSFYLYAALVAIDNSNFGSGNGAILEQWGGSLFGWGDSGTVARVYWNTQFGTLRIKNSSGSTLAEVSALVWVT